MILIHDSTRPHNYSVHAGWIFRALDHSTTVSWNHFCIYSKHLYTYLAVLDLTWLPRCCFYGRPPQAYVKLLLLPEWNLDAYSSRDSTQPLGAWHFDEHYGFMRRIFLFDQSNKFLGFLVIFLIYLFSSFSLQKRKKNIV